MPGNNNHGTIGSLWDGVLYVVGVLVLSLSLSLCALLLWVHGWVFLVLVSLGGRDLRLSLPVLAGWPALALVLPPLVVILSIWLVLHSFISALAFSSFFLSWSLGAVLDYFLYRYCSWGICYSFNAVLVTVSLGLETASQVHVQVIMVIR